MNPVKLNIHAFGSKTITTTATYEEGEVIMHLPATPQELQDGMTVFCPGVGYGTFINGVCVYRDENNNWIASYKRALCQQFNTQIVKKVQVSRAVISQIAHEFSSTSWVGSGRVTEKIFTD